MKETPVLKKIMLALGCLPYLRIWRNNTGQLWSGRQIIKIDRKGAMLVDTGDIVIKEAYPVKFGLPGSADLIGILAPAGRFIAVEVKGAKGRQRANQKNFEAMVTAMGGIYILAQSTEEAQARLNQYIAQGKNLNEPKHA